MQSKDKKTFFRAFTLIRTYAEGIFFTIFLALIIRNFVVTPYRVTNELMAPSIISGDFLMAYRLPYGLKMPWSKSKWGKKEPLRGELVIFPCPGKVSEKCMRRVVGLPGDRIEIRGERLFVNGTQSEYQAIGAHPQGFQLNESIGLKSYPILISGSNQRKSFGPIIVGPTSIFVLSDHRDLGEDSRNWGGLQIEKVEASVSFIWLSLNWKQSEDSSRRGWPNFRWSRVFTSPD